jgi:hypothetical protein
VQHAVPTTPLAGEIEHQSHIGLHSFAFPFGQQRGGQHECQTAPATQVVDINGRNGTVVMQAILTPARMRALQRFSVSDDKAGGKS